MPKVDTKNPQTHADFQAFARKHKCAECGANLVVLIEAVDFKPHYVVKCAENKAHVGIARPAHVYDPAEDMYGRPPKYIKEEIYKMSEAGQVDVETAGKLVPYTKIQVMTKDKAKEIIELLWKNAPTTEKERAILLCASKNLNPLMKHLYLLPFKNNKTGGIDWATIVSIQAKRTMAQRRGHYIELPLTDGEKFPSPRALTVEEAKMIFGTDWKSDRFYVGMRAKDALTGAVAVAYKFYDDKDPYGSDKGNSKFNMGSIRCETEILNKLYGDDDMPPDVQIMDTSNWAPPLTVEGEITSVNGQPVNKNTGEIQSTQATPEPPPTPAQPAAVASPEPATEEKKSPPDVSDISLVCPEHKKPWLLDRYKTHLYHWLEGNDTCRFKQYIDKELEKFQDTEREGMKTLIGVEYNKNRAKKAYWSQIPELEQWKGIQKYKVDTGMQAPMI